MVMFFHSNASLAGVIGNLKKWELPVKILERVQRNYTIRQADSGDSHIKPVLDIMYLEKADLDRATGISPGLPLGGCAELRTIYEEATHAWFDLAKEEPQVSLLIEKGIRYYNDAPLAGRGKADDPERVFQEAAGAYVGHRVATWWSTLENLAHAHNSLPRADVAFRRRLILHVGKIPGDYDREMKKRIFGYQEKGFLWNKKQVETRKVIPGELKDFCDRRLLENKIPDSFAQVEKFRRYHGEIRRNLGMMGP